MGASRASGSNDIAFAFWVRSVRSTSGRGTSNSAPVGDDTERAVRWPAWCATFRCDLLRVASLREGGDGRSLVAGDLRIDRERSQAFWKDQLIDLPLTQLWMVAALARSPGNACSHADLMRAAKIVVEPNTIAAHIKSIRQRFRAVDPTFDAIRTERSLGYRWVV